MKPWLDLFDSYDVDGSGTLTKEDFYIIAEKEQERKKGEERKVITFVDRNNF